MKNKNRVPQVTDEQIAAMANTGISDASVEQEVAERSGSDDKVQAVVAESAKPKVKTLTPEAASWVNRDPYGLKRVMLYGQRDRFALRYDDLTRRAQFLGRPLTVADLEELHSVDNTAPTTAVNCTVCSKVVTSFVRTAMINADGDLFRDQSGNATNRGQFVVTGKTLEVHAAHPGDCIFKLRDARNKKKTLANGRQVADLLPSQSFDQANARLAGIQGHFSAKVAEDQAFKQRLGFTVGDAARGNGRVIDGMDRGAAAPKMPRGQGQRRNERRWADNTDR